ncbi:hypothetical protein LSM04_004628 [Trypanosoma melophagium]|uniref:uncharacterized protein n=1 Tax=Trypanosoma melophagium TaxID=715481 RepID=UPI00351A91F3|nr:hypothetical protein LSM04_004628 [Trypanosoma melophagium]
MDYSQVFCSVFYKLETKGGVCDTVIIETVLIRWTPQVHITEDEMEWGSSAALCPFCCASSCTGMCLRSPKHEAHLLVDARCNKKTVTSPYSNTVSNVNHDVSPKLTLAVIDELLSVGTGQEGGDNTGGNNGALLRALTDSPGGSGKINSELKNAKMQLETLMMHYFPSGLPSQEGMDDVNGVFSHSDSSDGDNTSFDVLFKSRYFIANVEEVSNAFSKHLEVVPKVTQLLRQNPALAMMRAKVSQQKTPI